MKNLHSFFIFHSFFNVNILIFSNFFQKNFDFFQNFRKKSKYFLIYAIFQLKSYKNRGVSCNTYIPLYKESEPPGVESRLRGINTTKLRARTKTKPARKTTSNKFVKFGQISERKSQKQRFSPFLPLAKCWPSLQGQTWDSVWVEIQPK